MKWGLSGKSPNFVNQRMKILRASLTLECSDKVTAYEK